MMDGEEFPFVQDLDGRWHKRPADDYWTVNGDYQAATNCGLLVSSVHVSRFDPRLDRVRSDYYCRKCLGRMPK